MQVQDATSVGSARERSSLAVTTTHDEFHALAAEHRVVPVTRKVLADSETPLSAYRKLAANRQSSGPMRSMAPVHSPMRALNSSGGRYWMLKAPSQPPAFSHALELVLVTMPTA